MPTDITQWYGWNNLAKERRGVGMTPALRAPQGPSALKSELVNLVCNTVKRQVTPLICKGGLGSANDSRHIPLGNAKWISTYGTTTLTATDPVHSPRNCIVWRDVIIEGLLAAVFFSSLCHTQRQIQAICAEILNLLKLVVPQKKGLLKVLKSLHQICSLCGCTKTRHAKLILHAWFPAIVHAKQLWASEVSYS